MTSCIALLAGTCVAVGLLTSCSPGVPSIATAELRDNAGTVIGSAHFEPQGEDVKVLVEVTGLSPGAHGIHVHEVGKCEAPGFASAGNHFNPGGQPHHGDEGAHHAGDLPNLQIAADGTGRLEAVLRGITMQGRGHHSLFHVHGTSLLIHRDADDMVTSPSGNSGDRIACGVIVEAVAEPSPVLEIAIPRKASPVSIVATTPRDSTAITEMELDRLLAAWTRRPSGEIAMPQGRWPTAIVSSRRSFGVV